MEVFSTVSRYFVFYDWKRLGPPRQVDLLPYQPVGEAHLNDGTSEDLDAKQNMPNWLWKLPIGQPILRITLDDSENPDKCEGVKALLEPYLRMDQENGVFARIGLGYFNWPLIIRTGQPLKDRAVGLASPPVNSPKFQSQLSVMAKIVASLLRSYESGQRKDEILQWQHVLNQLPIATEPEIIADAVRNACQFAQS